jgi:hypothetical protein
MSGGKMKKLVLVVAVCCAFSVCVTATDINDDSIEIYTLRRFIENDSKDTQEVIRNNRAEAYKAIIKAEEVYFKARVKDTQSYEVYVTKADVLKTYDIEADKARGKAYEVLRQQFEVSESRTDADNSSTQNKEILYSQFDTARANAAKMCAILRKTETESIKSNSDEAVKLFNKAAEFYDKAVRSYGNIVITCSSINPVIIRAAEKVKGTKEYAKYEAYAAEKRKTAELWGKQQIYYERLKKISEAYAKVAAIRIELRKAAETYAKAAKSYVKAARTYAKVAKRSIKIPEADRLSHFKFEDAVELHKAHKISDAQLAWVPVSKASYNTVDAYAACCRTNLKLAEAIAEVCYEEDEAVKLKTELNKSSVEQAQDIVQRQVEGISCYY